jgi:hypothetical protein
MELMKSLYALTDIVLEVEELAKRWWVDPRVAYVHKEGVDVQVIPQLSKASKVYTVSKIALRINRGNMLEDYHKLQKGRGGSSHGDLSLNDLASVFHVYLNHVCNNGRDTARSLSHIITLFMGEHKWPILFEHFRIVY